MGSNEVPTRHSRGSLRLIQTDFNKIFGQFFTISLPVRWLQLVTLTRTLIIGHSRPENTPMMVILRYMTRKTQGQTRKAFPAPASVALDGGETRSSTQDTHQESVENTAPIVQLQVGPSFKIMFAMYMAEEMRVDSIPLTNGGRPFFLVDTSKLCATLIVESVTRTGACWQYTTASWRLGNHIFLVSCPHPSKRH